MTEQEFRKLAVNTVVDYTNAHLDKADGKTITADDVFVVWQVKVLQNNKALLSTALPDGMYYECTYNGDKDEMYVDCYKKWENFCVSPGHNFNLRLAAKFPVGTTVEITDETQVFSSSQYLKEHGLFSYYWRSFFERIDSYYNTTPWADMLIMRALVSDIAYDDHDKRYVYLISTEDNKFFAVAEDGLAPLVEEKPQ